MVGVSLGDVTKMSTRKLMRSVILLLIQCNCCLSSNSHIISVIVFFLPTHTQTRIYNCDGQLCPTGSSDPVKQIYKRFNTAAVELFASKK